jgi:ribonuclease HI
VQVQRQVERFYDIARYHGVVNVYKVAAHKKCWGNNYADMLAKWGRKMDGKLEIEFN